MLDDPLRQFLRGPVMQVLCVAGAGGKPYIGRGMGMIVADERDRIDIVISRWQWPGACALLANGVPLALTVCEVRTYEAYQLKGCIALLRTAGSDELELARRYIDETGRMLTSIGVLPEGSGAWTMQPDALVVALDVHEVFVQTPGDLAGRARQVQP